MKNINIMVSYKHNVGSFVVGMQEVGSEELRHTQPRVSAYAQGTPGIITGLKVATLAMAEVVGNISDDEEYKILLYLPEQIALKAFFAQKADSFLEGMQSFSWLNELPDAEQTISDFATAYQLVKETDNVTFGFRNTRTLFNYELKMEDNSHFDGEVPEEVVISQGNVKGLPLVCEYKVNGIFKVTTKTINAKSGAYNRYFIPRRVEDENGVVLPWAIEAVNARKLFSLAANAMPKVRLATKFTVTEVANLF